MKALREVLRQAAGIRGYREVGIERDSLAVELVRDRSPKTFARMLFLLAMGVGGIILTLNLVIFLIHDVVFFPNEPTINHRSGAIVSAKSCHREQVLLFFNTSEPWVDTGIRLDRDDRMKISASGAFHSSVGELERAARANERPRYDWVGTNRRSAAARLPESDPLFAGREKALAKEIPGSYIGAVLWQIRPDMEPCRSDWTRDAGKMGIRMLTPGDGQRFRTAGETGGLYFAVNDIYLNDAIISAYEQENIAALPAQEYNGNFGLRMTADSMLTGHPDSLKQLVGKKRLQLVRWNDREDTLCCFGYRFRQHFREHRDIWYNDNLGQIALTIDIQRHIPRSAYNLLLGNEWWYRKAETAVFHALDRGEWGKAALAVAGILAAGAAIFLVLIHLTALVLYPTLYKIYGRRLRSIGRRLFGQRKTANPAKIE